MQSSLRRTRGQVGVRSRRPPMACRPIGPSGPVLDFLLEDVFFRFFLVVFQLLHLECVQSLLYVCLEYSLRGFL